MANGKRVSAVTLLGIRKSIWPVINPAQQSSKVFWQRRTVVRPSGDTA